ncbi:MAG: hypothetical protein Q8O42_09735 [Acidobacteriota bacterium]|nr:hypothetical protein [Acidobacteriota bacterium]
MARPKNTSRLEKSEQLAIRELMITLGAEEYVIGTVRRKGDYPGTMQTPGIPDLQFFLPEKRAWRSDAGKASLTRRFVVVEAKRAKGGRFSSQQIEYRGLCAAAGVDYIGGSLDDVIAWLIAEGYLKASQVPHYRLPQVPA